MLITEPNPLDLQPVPPGVRVDVREATGVVALGLITLVLVIILGIVAIRLTGRRSA